MKILVATGNRAKLDEIVKILKNFEVISYKKLLGEMEIDENGHNFEENSYIKAEAIFDALKKSNIPNIDEYLVLADDSGISIDALDGRPGVLSARYAGIGSSDEENLDKVIGEMLDIGINNSIAKFETFISIVSSNMEIRESFSGELKGSVITEKRGKNGFGYDPIFIPDGGKKTLAELTPAEKNRISHRKKALLAVEKFLSIEENLSILKKEFIFGNFM